MSRSETIPPTLSPSTLTTSAPMRSRFSISTASAIVASGRIVATQSPLLRRIVSTFIGYPPERGDGRGGPVASGLGSRPVETKIGQNVAGWKARNLESPGSTRPAARLDGFGFDPVIGVKPDQILDFLAHCHERVVADPRITAGRD